MLISQPVFSPGSFILSKPKRASISSVNWLRSSRLRADMADPSSLGQTHTTAALKSRYSSVVNQPAEQVSATVRWITENRNSLVVLVSSTLSSVRSVPSAVLQNHFLSFSAGTTRSEINPRSVFTSPSVKPHLKRILWLFQRFVVKFSQSLSLTRLLFSYFGAPGQFPREQRWQEGQQRSFTGQDELVQPKSLHRFLVWEEVSNHDTASHTAFTPHGH